MSTFHYCLILFSLLHIAEINCKRSFIVISPLEFDVGEKEAIHVTLIDINKPGNVSVRLINDNGTLLSEVNRDFKREGSKTLELDVPSHLENDTYNNNSNYRLQVVGNFEDYKFEKNEKIQIRTNKELVFLNTDKPFYKAGQTVKFRALIINSDLKLLKNTPVGNIWITDKNETRVAQWKNKAFCNGFVHEELELPDEPVLGKWLLHVEVNKIYTTKDFEIKENVQPTFGVTITPPLYYVNKRENITWNVCAKYTFGIPVEGKLRTVIRLILPDHSEFEQIFRNLKLINGCVKITLNREDTILRNYRQNLHCSLKFFAEVTEEGTDIKVNASSDTYLSFHKYIISRDDNHQYFRPGIPIRTKITIRTPDNKSVVNETLSVCAMMKRENRKNNSQIIASIETCKVYTSNENGEIFITIPRQPSNTLNMSIEVKGNETEARILKFSLTQWFSATGHNLQIEPISSAVECGKSAEITVLYTSNGPETRKIYYQVASKGDIIDDRLVFYTFDPKDDLSNQRDETYLDSVSELVSQEGDIWKKFPTLKYVGKFSFKLKVNFEMHPNARVIIYSITEDGNIYADSISFEVRSCLKNQIKMKFIDHKQFPGVKTAIQVSAAPQSVCSIAVVEKSAYLLHENDLFTKSKKAGVLILCDLELETRPAGDLQHRTTTAFSLEQPHTTKSVPETWLWGIYFVDTDGNLLIKENMPDSITEWEGNSVCLHSDAGLGISDKASIVAFQPFFTSLILPYSIVRGEVLPVVITVFNYLENCLPITITLDQTEDFEIYNGTFFSKECICAGKNVTKRFFIKPKTLGTVNITVTAATIKGEVVCENSDIADISRSNSLTKPLVIEAEGFPKEDVKNIFFCMEDVSEDSFKAKHELLRRDDVVEGSDRAYVFLTGNVMGPTLEGLERLVKVPTGKGFGNIHDLASNIAVFDYLGSTKRLNATIKARIVNNINRGYKRQQQYRHPDASYSSDGQNNLFGNLRLTTLVIRSFAKASKYVNVDQTELERSRHWIISNQLDNGCFPHTIRFNKNMKKEILITNDATLTAFVTSALVESGNVSDIVIAKAKQCIQAKQNPNDELAIFAYMATLTNDLDAEKYLEQLLNDAVTKGFSMYWKNKNKSVAIEIASFAMLALLKSPNEEHFRKVGPIARWLSLQLNSYEEFPNYEDSVMPLQALAEYILRINRHGLKMELTVSSNDLIEIFQLNEENKLLTQKSGLPIFPTGVEVEAEGDGCALVQIVHRYNIPHREEKENYVLSIQAERKRDNCQTASIGICARLRKERIKSNMVVFEIKMVSGFEVDKGSVEKLLSIPDMKHNKYKIKDNQIDLYFKQLTDHKECFSFDVHEKIAIEHKQPAIAKVYDYYNQGEEATVSYSITDECRILK